MTDWKNDVEVFREQKDQFLARHPRSPIPEAERGAFESLDYYPVDSTYRVMVNLEEYSEKETITVETTQDGEQQYLVYGSFSFSVDGNEVTLQAYQQQGEDTFWVPFRDETNGDETYEAGRYLDLDPEEDKQGDKWILDFNKAYNPFCAYSDKYECPLVPMNNWLDIGIEAGEKTYQH